MAVLAALPTKINTIPTIYSKDQIEKLIIEAENAGKFLYADESKAPALYQGFEKMASLSTRYAPVGEAELSLMSSVQEHTLQKCGLKAHNKTLLLKKDIVKSFMEQEAVARQEEQGRAPPEVKKNFQMPPNQVSPEELAAWRMEKDRQREGSSKTKGKDSEGKERG